MNLPLPSSFPATSFPATSFKPFVPTPKLNVYLVGDATPILTFYDDRGNRRHWETIQTELATHFDCLDEEVGAPDCYFGGEYGDDETLDCITIRGEIVAAFAPITAEQVTAIYASPSNDHAKLKGASK